MFKHRCTCTDIHGRIGNIYGEVAIVKDGKKFMEGEVSVKDKFPPPRTKPWTVAIYVNPKSFSKVAQMPHHKWRPFWIDPCSRQKITLHMNIVTIALS